MDDKYIITVTGTQEINGESDTIEVITTGDYYEKDGHKYILYKEYDNENPEKFTKTTIDILNDKITIKRENEYTSILLLEKNERHQCHYQTEMGSVVMGVYTKDLEDKLSATGGNLTVNYQIDFFVDLISNNKFCVNIKEKK